MVTVSLVFNLQALYLAAVAVTTLLVYILILKWRERRNRDAITKINTIVSDYFKSHNVEVLVTSYAALGGRGCRDTDVARTRSVTANISGIMLS